MTGPTAKLLWFVCLLELHAGSAVPPASTQAAPCSSAEYHAFDFWLGDWDAFESGNPVPVARVRVDRILDGCVLREQYDGKSGVKGESFSIFDASRKVWHQTWMTSRGRLLEIEGNPEGRRMALTGSDRLPDGSPRQARGTWEPMKTGVRETAFTSSDRGKTWQLWFDLIFRPRLSRVP